jgi:hypothetical protein
MAAVEHAAFLSLPHIHPAGTLPARLETPRGRFDSQLRAKIVTWKLPTSPFEEAVEFAR